MFITTDCDQGYKELNTQRSNTLDYFNSGNQVRLLLTLQNEIQEKLKSRSYNGTHKRQSTINHPTFDHALDNIWKNEISSTLYSKTNSGISKLKSQKQLNGGNSESERTLFMKSKLMHTGSFENCPPKNFLYDERDSLTEQREARRNGKTASLVDREGSLKHSSRRISGNLKSPKTQEGDQTAEEK